ncbi:hypothetical protein B0H11DRAFT_2183537 [Mycena galericulata]|nr:hypothetical protein B0H11DRAFT_2183537 [Mycena galericulata]
MGERDTSLGALFVGYWLAWGLYGVMSMQTFNYFRKFPKDSIWLKGLVLGLWLLNTLQIVLIGLVMYYWLITNYDNPAVLADSVWSFTIGILVTIFHLSGVDMQVQYLVNSTLILKLSQTQFNNLHRLTLYLGFEIEIRYFWMLSLSREDMKRESESLNKNEWSTRRNAEFPFQLLKLALFFKFEWIASVGLACASAADILIAVSLCYYLLRGRTGLRETNSLVTKLILYAMTTGLLTSIIVFMDMICFLTMPQNLIHFSFNIVVGKLYTNSLLASLNFRETARNNQDVINTFSLASMNTSRNGPTCQVPMAKEDSFLTAANTANTTPTMDITCASSDLVHFELDRL